MVLFAWFAGGLPVDHGARDAEAVLNDNGAGTFDFGEWKSKVASRKNGDRTISFITIDSANDGFEFVVADRQACAYHSRWAARVRIHPSIVAIEAACRHRTATRRCRVRGRFRAFQVRSDR